MSKARDYFTTAQQKELTQDIAQAEKNTSGEIRIHLESRCNEHVLDRAAAIFASLNMHKTKLRNGVLFYLSVEDRKFAILGDAGINTKVEPDFWDHIKATVIENFKLGHYTQGLCQGIVMAGEKLKVHFPHQADDVNELSNDISFDNP